MIITANHYRRHHQHRNHCIVNHHYYLIIIINDFVKYQGHKQIKKEAKRDSSGELYQIIRKNGSSDADDNTNMASSLNRMQSFFSLKSKRSLRLQKWGPWIAYEDQNTNSVYWYNHETAEGQWQKPDLVISMQQSNSKNMSDVDVLVIFSVFMLFCLNCVCLCVCVCV